MDQVSPFARDLENESRASKPQVLDTRFRSALSRMAHQGRILTFDGTADPHLEVAAIMKNLDGHKALLFPSVSGYDIPVIGNLLSSKKNCEAAFGLDFNGIRGLVQRAMGAPLAPQVVAKAPAHEVVETAGFDIGKLLPALFHAPGDAGRYVTAGIVVVKDPVTGVYNASYHRLQLLGPDRVAIKLDFGRHLRLAFERSKERGEALAVAVCIGTDLALHFTAATMGSQMPESADELAGAGGVAGRGLQCAEGGVQEISVARRRGFWSERRVLVNR